MEEILIKDGNVVIGEASAPIDEIFQMPSHYDEILPPGCVYAETSRQGMTTFVVEEQPQIRTLNHQITLTDPGIDRKKGDYRKVRIATPYVIHVVSFSSVRFSDAPGTQFNRSHVFFRTEPLKSIDDLIAPAPLLNVNTNADACLGHTALYHIQYGIEMPDTQILNEWAKRGYVPKVDQVSTNKRLGRYFERFWGARFNWDMGDPMMKKAAPPLNDIEEWERRTTADPDFIFDVTLRGEVPLRKWLASKPVTAQMVSRTVLGHANTAKFSAAWKKLLKPV